MCSRNWTRHPIPRDSRNFGRWLRSEANLFLPSKKIRSSLETSADDISIRIPVRVKLESDAGPEHLWFEMLIFSFLKGVLVEWKWINVNQIVPVLAPKRLFMGKKLEGISKLPCCWKLVGIQSVFCWQCNYISEFKVHGADTRKIIPHWFNYTSNDPNIKKNRWTRHIIINNWILFPNLQPTYCNTTNRSC